MAQDIDQFLFATLNADSTLQSLWGNPATNPYAVVAEQDRAFPYSIYQMIAKQTDPILSDPTGTYNEWVYSFTTFAVGSNTMAGRRQAKTIANRIVTILTGIQQPRGFMAAWEVSRNEAWNELEKAYRYTVDLQIQETLLCS